ncbi:MAG: radical SAM-associated putative lipoprotein [Paludibacteraceae bacterium]|nr:radical SAM-associated putative lipoprotein [Paludibacteraceae bacterium]
MKLNLLRQKCNNLLQRFIRLFSLTSVAFVVTACYGSPYAEYDVEGYVYDENGNMLENMQVVVRTFDAQWDYPDTVYTNQDGHYHAVHSLTSTGGDCMEVIVHDTTGVYASDSTHISSGKMKVEDQDSWSTFYSMRSDFKLKKK